MKMRTQITLVLFTSACFVIIYVGISSILDFVSTAKSGVEPAEYIKFLASISAFFLAALLVVRVAAAKTLAWAAQHEHRQVLGFFHRIAPRFTRRILSSIVGTSIALSATVAANAGGTIPEAGLENAYAAERGSLPGATEATQRTVPNAQWFPEQVSVPLGRLVSSSAQPKQEHRRTTTEVVVAQGENLWSISARLLGAQATAEEISVYWPQIYQANRQAIGPDPNHLEVGTVLVLPPAE
ncbi:LysM peptidoglycan-binding domain-containing protein [Glutamicibacter sp. TV12E]|uniref:LysM peptidoglycan-binding domain-containing protein n=1 Tax=Glutamicibacter sp. TV12E TaxID=3446362 RepID=UPI0040331B7A